MQANASLSVKQSQLIAALLQGLAIVDAAAACKVNESTAHRWLHLPEVQAALKAGQDELFEAALDELKRLMPKAIKTLKKHLDAPVMVTAATQLAAGRFLIEQSLELFKVAELEERLKALEERITEKEGKRW